MHLFSVVSHDQLVLSCYLVFFCLQWRRTISWMLRHKEVTFKGYKVTRRLPELSTGSMDYSLFFIVMIHEETHV